MEVGIQPHLIACRARHLVADKVREKIAMFSNVPIRRVFSMHDRKSIYTIPEAMHSEGQDIEILSILDLHSRVRPAQEDTARREWSRFVNRLTGERASGVRIGITGKYAALRDAYASIDKSLEHCGAALSADIQMKWIDTTEMDPANRDDVAGRLEGLDGVIVPGGFGVRGTEGKIACVRYCREQGLPYLGICLGLQMAVVEYARNVCGIDGAASSEFDPQAADPVIDILPEQKKIEGLGGNMRLGGHDVQITPGTLAAFLYQGQGPGAGKGQGPRAEGREARRSSSASALGPDPSALFVRQRFRHRYEVDPRYVDRLAEAGLVFSGRHPEHPIMQIVELAASMHPYFIAAQFHPELTSRPLRPAPLFMGLVAAAMRHADRCASSPLVDRWTMKPDSHTAAAT
jgi:CTP synthase